MSALVAADKRTIRYPPPGYSDENLEDEATGFSSDEDYFDEGLRPPSTYNKWDNC